MNILSEPVEHVAAGMAVWAAANLVTHPLHLYEIKAQQHVMHSPGTGMLKTLKETIRFNPFRGVLFSIPCNAMQRLYVPLLYEKWKLVRNNTGTHGIWGQTNIRTGVADDYTLFHVHFAKLCIGVGALMAPFDYIRDNVLVKLVAQDRISLRSRGTPITTARGIMREFRPAFFRALPSYTVLAVVRYAAFFGILEAYHLWREDFVLRDPTSVDAAVAGALAGAGSTFATHSIATCAVNSMSQVQYKIIEPTYGLNRMRQVFAASGTSTMRGVGPAVVRSALLWGPTFVLYDVLRCQLTGKEVGHAYYYD